MTIIPCVFFRWEGGDGGSDMEKGYNVAQASLKLMYVQSYVVKLSVTLYLQILRPQISNSYTTVPDLQSGAQTQDFGYSRQVLF